MWDRFLRACCFQSVDRTPVWFMRQAGRYMSEYRAIRARRTLIEICKAPELATQVTLQPVQALGVDAAILFADILLPLEPMRASFEFRADDGPLIHSPIGDRAGVDALRIPDPEADLGYVLETVRLVRRELEGKTPLVGFAGAPFTMASYLIEGGKSTSFLRTKRFMHREPAIWASLLEKLVEVVRRYLRAQIGAGAQAVQIFDSWAGALTVYDYAEFVAPYMKVLFDDLKTTGVPVIHFSADNGHLLELQRDTGGSVIGVGWQTPIDVAATRLGKSVAIQGNLDPVALLAPRPILARRVEQILEAVKRPTGYVFNLGHGILPETDPAAVAFVVDRVHSWRTE